MLDSIANLSVAAPTHEVIAVALHLTSSSVHLCMAGNRKVPQNTVNHMSKLWSLLQDLSNDYAKYHKHYRQMISQPQPKTHALPQVAQKKVKEFRREALKFCAEKFNRCISKHLSSFLAVNSSKLPPNSIFATLQGLLPNLAEAIKTRETFSNMRWENIWDGLKTVHALTSEMFKGEPDICKTVDQTFPVKRYLEKLVGVTKDVKILLNAANSPRLRRHFKAHFSIETVDPIGPTAALLPSTINAWENVAFKALEEINRGKLERGEIEWEAVASKVRADAQRVNSRAPPPQHSVHCECILLSHMLFHQEKSFVNYIGVSELCCRGCFQLIQSANFANGTRFVTKGCHHKWYYPWKFPPIPETTKNVVVKRMYTDLATLFGNIYAGFRPKTQKTLSYSEDPQLSEDDYSSQEDLSVIREHAKQWSLDCDANRSQL